MRKWVCSFEWLRLSPHMTVGLNRDARHPSIFAFFLRKPDVFRHAPCTTQIRLTFEWQGGNSCPKGRRVCLTEDLEPEIVWFFTKTRSKVTCPHLVAAHVDLWPSGLGSRYGAATSRVRILVGLSESFQLNHATVEWSPKREKGTIYGWVVIPEI